MRHACDEFFDVIVASFVDGESVGLIAIAMIFIETRSLTRGVFDHRAILIRRVAVCIAANLYIIFTIVVDFNTLYRGIGVAEIDIDGIGVALACAIDADLVGAANGAFGVAGA